LQTGSSHILIEVSPLRLEVALVRSRRIVSAAAHTLTPGEPGRQVAAWLADLRAPLASILSDLACKGCSATVIYSSASTPVAVTSAPCTLGAAEAEEASRLALAGVADFPLDDAPHQIVRLLSDVPAKARGPVPAARQNHALAAAEQASALDAIAQWVQDAGLVFAGAVPAGAVAMRGAALAAWGCGRRAGDRAAALWIGEQGSALACVTEGAVRFVRPVGVGLESLVDALCRPLRGRDDGAQELTLDRDAARELLRAVGVPAPDAALPGYPGFTGASLLPVMQPALQRLTIETKQSLRFGLTEAERGNVQFVLVGIGAEVPGLGEWVARQCGLTLSQSDAPAHSIAHSARGSAAIIALSEDAGALPMLVPARQARRAMLGRARAALVAGVVVAGAWLGTQWYSARADLAEQQTRLLTLETAVLNGEAISRVREGTLAARKALSDVRARAAATRGSGISAAGLLEAIALATPPDVRISAIEFTKDKDRLMCRVAGSVALGESTDPTGAITDMADAMKSTPIVRSARLGAIQRTRIEGAQAHAFDLLVELVALPADLAEGAGDPALVSGSSQSEDVP